jgi:hypothetical protein
METEVTVLAEGHAEDAAVHEALEVTVETEVTGLQKGTLKTQLYMKHSK